MQRRFLTSIASGILAGGLFIIATGADQQPDKSTTPRQSEKSGDEPVAPPDSVAEARARARLLHESFHATLQFVHDEYYRPDEKLQLPAKTLERAFEELDRRHKVQLRWLAVNAIPMNVDHEPRDEFEKAAVASLKAGQNEFDRVENGIYRHAATITLTSGCLKCHLPARTDAKNRAAALIISMPLKQQNPSR